jgi:Ca2+-binding RTX toxin-like protein
VVNSLSSSTSSALDLNQLYSDQNQIFGAAAQTQVMAGLLNFSPFIDDFSGGVSVTGGASGANNKAYAGSVDLISGNLTAAFGIEYTGNTLYGYSPDPDFIQSTIINATLNGANGGTTAWSLLGGNGNDSIIGGDNADTIYGDADLRSGGNDDDTISGGNGDDLIVGNDGDDSILGGAGVNTIGGGAGADTIVGGNDGNFIQGGTGNNSLVGGAGNDTIYGGEQNVPGISGNDTIVGSLGNDSLFGQDGNDLFQFEDGVLTIDATIDGGNGTNTLSFTDPATTVIDSAFTNVVNIDVLTTANGAGSSLTLGTEASGAGIDTVQGGNGNDTLVLEAGFTTAVTLIGGNGNDSIQVASYSQIDPSATPRASIDGGVGTTDALTIAAAAGNSGSFAVISDASVINIEELRLSNAGPNYVNLTSPGTWGIASVFGGTSVRNEINAAGLTTAASYYGGTSNDVLIGAAGANDLLKGYSGLAASNTSNDTLTGGTTDDIFIMAEASDTQNAYAFTGVSGPLAWITDFQAGASNDVIQVEGAAGSYNVSALVGVAGFNYELTTAGATVAYLNVSGFTTEANFRTDNLAGV